ncbi:MAG: hypothetical protein LBU90_10075 [Bacteroidales bacterium]|jgi:hypothetical protein|nr:hypothetical protein [Bacteroidales bacterium]
MNIELSERQFQTLLETYYIGEYMKQAYGNSDDSKELAELGNILYEAAYNAGLDEDVEFDKQLGGYAPTAEFEAECDDIINTYDENNFWEELIIQLANRDAQAQGLDDMSSKEFQAAQQVLIDKYEKEFAENGVDNLFVNEE